MAATVLYLAALCLTALGRPATSCYEENFNCYDPPCMRMIECVYGICDQVNNKCRCDNCFTGPDCSESVESTPYFEPYIDEARISSVLPGFPIYHVDIDNAEICPNSDQPCTCGTVLYAMSADSAEFEINKDGEIILKKEADLGKVKTVNFLISMSEDGGNNVEVSRIKDGDRLSSKMKTSDWLDVKETVDEESEKPVFESAVIRRVKRAINYSSTSVINSTQFVVERKDNYELVTDLAPGEELQVEMAIVFNKGTTTAVEIEVFAPENETLSFVISNAQFVFSGNCLDVNLSDLNEHVVKLRDNDNSYPYYDTWQYSLATVTNDEHCADGSNVSHNSLVMEYEITMIQPSDYSSVFGIDQRVAGGVAYTDPYGIPYVHIHQMIFTPVIEDVTEVLNEIVDSQFEIVGPSEIGIGETDSFVFKINLAHTYLPLEVEFYAPDNDTDQNLEDSATILYTGVRTLGEKFQAIDKDAIIISYLPSSTGNSNTTAHVNFGKIFRAASPSASADSDLIEIQMVITLADDVSLIGKTFWIGAAVLVGSTRIWVGEVSVIAVEPNNRNESLSYNDENPTVEVSELSEFVGIGQTMICNLDVDIPALSSYFITLEGISTVSNNTLSDEELLMEICRVELVSVGENFQLYSFNQTPDTLVADSADYDGAMSLKLSYIHNADIYPNLPEPSKIRYKLYYDLVDHSSITNGSTIDATFGLYFGEKKVWVSSHVITIHNTSESEITANTKPSFSISSVDDTMISGETFDVDLTVSLQPETSITPFNLIMGAVNMSNPQIKVCTIKLVSAGNNFPCVEQSYKRRSVTISSGENELRFVMSGLHNVDGSTNVSDFMNNTDNQVVFRAYFQTRYYAEETSSVQDTTLRLGSSMPDLIWVGAAQFDIVDNRTGWADQLSGVMSPVVSAANITMESLSTETVTVRIKPPADQLSIYTVSFTSDHPNITICNPQVENVGVMFVCGVEIRSIEKITNGISVTLSPIKGYQDFYMMTGDDSFDILVDVALSENDTTVTTLDVTIQHGHTTTSASAIINVDLAQDRTKEEDYLCLYLESSTLDSLTTPQPVSRTSIMTGESMRFLITVQAKSPYLPHHLELHLISSDNPSLFWDMISLKLVSYDEEAFMCMDTENIHVEQTANCGNLTLDVGFVTINNETEGDKTLRFEGVARLQQFHTLDLNSTITMTAGLQYGDKSLIMLSTYFFNVETNSSLYPNFSDPNQISVNAAVSSNLVQLKSRGNSLSYTVATEEYSTVHITLEIISDNPAVYFTHVQLYSAGLNVNGVNLDTIGNPLAAVRDSNGAIATIEIGTITNLGKSSLVADSTLTYDIFYDLVDTHSSSLVDDLRINLDFVSEFNGGTASQSDQTSINSQRDANYQPDLSVTVTSGCTTLTEGSSMNVMTDIRNSNNTGSYTAHDVEIVVYRAPFMQYNSPASFTQDKAAYSNGITMADPTIENIDSRTIIKIAHILPGERVSVTLGFDIIRTTQKAHPPIADIPWKLSYKFVNMTTLQKEENPLDYFTCDMNIPEIFDASLLITAPPEGCNLTDVTKSDVLIKSAPLDPDTLVEYLQYEHPDNEYMRFGNRTPIEDYKKHRYIEFNLKSLHFVSSFNVTTEDAASYIYKAQLSYDGRSFVTVRSGTADSAAEIGISRKMNYFRLIFEDPADLSVKMEIMGCSLESNTNSILTPPAEYILAPRQISATSSHVYICDSKAGHLLPAACYSHHIQSGNWKVMDSRLNNLIGFNRNTDTVLGVGKNGEYLFTQDNGMSWNVLDNNLYTQIKSNINAAYSIPWKSPLPDLESTTHRVNNTVYTFAADERGVHKKAASDTNWKKIVDWQQTP